MFHGYLWALQRDKISKSRTFFEQHDGHNVCELSMLHFTCMMHVFHGEMWDMQAQFLGKTIKWSWSDGIRKWELIFCSDSVCISSPNDTKSMSKQLVKISSKSFVMHLLAVQWWSCSAVCGFLMMITLNHRAISILL